MIILLGREPMPPQAQIVLPLAAMPKDWRQVGASLVSVHGPILALAGSLNNAWNTHGKGERHETLPKSEIVHEKRL